MFLQPSEIRFSQLSIGAAFRNTKRLGETLDELITEKVARREIPQLHVSIVDGKFFSMDNRRLWVFKQLEELGECSPIHVKITPVKWSKMNTVTEGEDIHIRGTPGGYVWKSIRAAYEPSLDTISEEVECRSVYSTNVEQVECRSVYSNSYDGILSEEADERIGGDDDLYTSDEYPCANARSYNTFDATTEETWTNHDYMPSTSYAVDYPSQCDDYPSHYGDYPSQCGDYPSQCGDYQKQSTYDDNLAGVPELFSAERHIELIARRKCRARRGLFGRNKSKSGRFVGPSCDRFDEGKQRKPRNRKRHASEPHYNQKSKRRRERYDW